MINRSNIIMWATGEEHIKATLCRTEDPDSTNRRWSFYFNFNFNFLQNPPYFHHYHVKRQRPFDLVWSLNFQGREPRRGPGLIYHCVFFFHEGTSNKPHLIIVHKSHSWSDGPYYNFFFLVCLRYKQNRKNEENRPNHFRMVGYSWFFFNSRFDLI